MKMSAGIPPGAVVVARQPSARLVLVMDRIAAIITEVGSPTDHMTILAREFRIPTLVEVGGATKVLHSGQLVTVDADAALIYPGIIPELLAAPDEARRRMAQRPGLSQIAPHLEVRLPVESPRPREPGV